GVERIAVADVEGTRREVDAARRRTVLAERDEDRVPIAAGQRLRLRILDADDVEIVVRATKVDAARSCRRGRRDAGSRRGDGEKSHESLHAVRSWKVPLQTRLPLPSRMRRRR